MSKILITGGAGFIGSHLCSLLHDSTDHDVVILDNFLPQVHGNFPARPPFLDFNKFSLVYGSIADQLALDHALDSVDVVVHLASETGTGQSMYELYKYCQTNVSSTALLLETILHNHSSVSKFILSSSRSVYGEGAYLCSNPSCNAHNLRVFPTNRDTSLLLKHAWDPLCTVCSAPLIAVGTSEHDPVCPTSIYASTKLSQEMLVKVFCSSNNIDYSILRFQNVYGEYQSLSNPYTGILSIFSNRIRLGLPLPVFEDGLESRDFVYVKDVANVLLKCIDSFSTCNAIINVGSGLPVSVLDVCSTLLTLLEVDVPIEITSTFRKGDIRHNFSDNSQFHAFFPDHEYTSLHTGLSSFISWVLTQPTSDDRLTQANNELAMRKLLLSAN
jgi:dTDP-L-rhamnose 4-epimerase